MYIVQRAWLMYNVHHHVFMYMCKKRSMYIVQRAGLLLLRLFGLFVCRIARVPLPFPSTLQSILLPHSESASPLPPKPGSAVHI